MVDKEKVYFSKPETNNNNGARGGEAQAIIFFCPVIKQFTKSKNPNAII
jgi:hypothetical protein